MIITTLPRITSNRILDEQTMDQTLAVAITLCQKPVWSGKYTYSGVRANGLTHNTGNIYNDSITALWLQMYVPHLKSKTSMVKFEILIQYISFLSRYSNYIHPGDCTRFDAMGPYWITFPPMVPHYWCCQSLDWQLCLSLIYEPGAWRSCLL